MTTAHRPTWKAAYGLSDSVNKGYVPTRSYSARDLPSYLNLKERKFGQGNVEELKHKDFKAQLLKREDEAKRIKKGEITKAELETIQEGYAPDVDFIQQYQSVIRKKIKRPEQESDEQIADFKVNPFPEDADSQQFVKEDEGEANRKRKRVESEKQSDSEDEDSEELLREYERIKEQREKQELHKRQIKHKQSMANRESQLLKGNPLLNSSYSLTKRWYEDTVFRNQAKKVEEKKSFINDHVRSEFHRKFMNRYVMR